MRAHQWAWLYCARLPQWRLPQWRFPASPGLGGPRAIHEYCRTPYDLSTSPRASTSAEPMMPPTARIAVPAPSAVPAPTAVPASPAEGPPNAAAFASSRPRV
jgi:hypothetical protein